MPPGGIKQEDLFKTPQLPVQGTYDNPEMAVGGMDRKGRDSVGSSVIGLFFVERLKGCRSREELFGILISILFSRRIYIDPWFK